MDGTLVVITIENRIEELYNQVASYGEFRIMTARILLNDIMATVAKELYDGQEQINEVAGLLYDEESRRIYHEAIRRRMLYGETDFRDLIVRGDAEYRIPMTYEEQAPRDEVILDCGAYNGDTLKKFVNTYGPTLKKIYCIECMEDSLKRLKQEVGWLQNRAYVPEIAILPYALSDHEGTMKFAETIRPNGSFVVDSRAFATRDLFETNYVEVAVASIDHLIPQEERVTMIKMDIEGSEYEAVLGAERVIRQYKPRLAISIYHSGKDYYRLALLIKRFVPEYKIAVRHHNKKHCDTDLYCWV